MVGTTVWWERLGSERLCVTEGAKGGPAGRMRGAREGRRAGGPGNPDARCAPVTVSTVSTGQWKVAPCLTPANPDLLVCECPDEVALLTSLSRLGRRLRRGPVPPVLPPSTTQGPTPVHDPHHRPPMDPITYRPSPGCARPVWRCGARRGGQRGRAGSTWPAGVDAGKGATGEKGPRKGPTARSAACRGRRPPAPALALGVRARLLAAILPLAGS